MAASKVKNLNICGIAVPFDGVPRLAEIEAYDAAIKAGGTNRLLVEHIAPATINTRMPQQTEWTLQPTASIPEDTVLGILDVILCIEGALNSPKVKARLTEIQNLLKSRNP